ncbi:hypothetical protein Tco_1407629 [Tanacetum coccineum]
MIGTDPYTLTSYLTHARCHVSCSDWPAATWNSTVPSPESPPDHWSTVVNGGSQRWPTTVNGGGPPVNHRSIVVNGQSTGGPVYKWLEENIESVIGINKDDIDEEDDESSTMEPPSRNEAIKAAITLNNFLLSYEKTTPEVLTMLRKIRDEIQGEIDFNKKQKTIESFFKKPS